MDLRVWSSNLLYTVQDAERVAAAIAREAPDVALLQELTPAVAEILAPRFRSELPHQLLAPRNDADGFGILSRFPLEDGGIEVLPGGNLFLQRATVASPRLRFDVYNCHLVSPVDADAVAQFGYSGLSTLRQAQAGLVADLVRAAGRPAIVAGDLNASPGQSPYVAIDAVARALWPLAGVGPGLTWPMTPMGLGGRLLPLAQLDHVFATAAFDVLSARAIPARTGSDHAPMVVDLRAAPWPGAWW
jgi:endonuclease/exonuclease/phosphatase (EEP) superfamily protein YafD